jgi:hypothetical protein
MKILVNILIWAILLGFLVSGVKVMATSPGPMIPVQAITTPDSDVTAQPGTLHHTPVHDSIRPAGSDSPGSVDLGR